MNINYRNLYSYLITQSQYLYLISSLKLDDLFNDNYDLFHYDMSKPNILFNILLKIQFKSQVSIIL